MNNAATLRRVAMAVMVVAIVSGFVSLFLLMTGRMMTPVLAMVSAFCLVLGLVLDRRAGRLG
jgi:CHASE2 domain-containing sensor protein